MLSSKYNFSNLKKALVLPFCLMVAWIPQSVLASKDQVKKNEVNTDNDSNSKEWLENRPFQIYMGVEGGMLRQNTNLSSESDKGGGSVGVKALGSFHWPTWVLDLGLGWGYSKVEGDTGSFKTKAPFAEFSSRYRINRLQIGTVTQFMFSDNLNFDEPGSPNYDSLKTLVTFGPQILYHIPLNFDSRWQFRSGLKFYTDLNLKDRTLYGGVFEIQVGYIPRKNKKPEEIIPLKEVQKDTQALVVASAAPEKASVNVLSEQKIMLTLNEAAIPFETGKSELKQEMKEFLRLFATLLVNQENNWENVQVDGHADKRGSYELNKKLSTARAQSVANSIQDGGIDQKRVKVQGWSYDKPLDVSDSESAYEKNRRVEISVEGISDIESFKNELNELVQNYFKKE